MIPATPLAAVLLDLDGTLLDTAPDLARALNTLRAEQRQQPLAFEHIRPQVSNGTNAVLRLGFPGADTAQFERLRARFLELYRAQLVVDTKLFPGFDEVLLRLEAHRIPWGVITNKPRWLTEPLMQQLGLYQRADVADWPVTAWIHEPLDLLAWVGLARSAPQLAPRAGA